MMTLSDILNLVDENANVYITTEEDNKLVTFYDGKNSIDPCYNDCKVVRIYPYDLRTIEILIAT